jgi:hypothetical protein
MLTTSVNSPERHYGIASDYDHLPPLTISQEWSDEAYEEVFGGEDEIRLVSVSSSADSNWARLFDQFYSQRIVHVLNINVLLLRFEYDYEIDLHEINSKAALLNWVLHLTEKVWITTQRLHFIIEAIADIKGFNVHRY